jgi:hypothetical protein
MNLLLDDALAPITSQIGFVEMDAGGASGWFQNWEAFVQQERGVRVDRREVSGNLSTILRTLEPLTSLEPRRFLFVPTTGSWTAYFDNGWRGTDGAVLSHVAQELRCRALRVVAVPDSMGTRASRLKKGRYGATTLEIYGPERTHFLNYIRSISSTNDGGRWAFVQTGKPQPFEDLSAYQAHSIQKRFPLVLLASYLNALGVNAFDDSFYAPQGKAFLIERHGPTAAGLREYSVSDVQATWHE